MATLIAKSKIEEYETIEKLYFTVDDFNEETKKYEIKLTNEKFQWWIFINEDEMKLFERSKRLIIVNSHPSKET